MSSGQITTVNGKRCTLVKKSSSPSQALVTNSQSSTAATSAETIFSSSSSSFSSSSSSSSSPLLAPQASITQAVGTVLPAIVPSSSSNNVAQNPTVAIPPGPFTTSSPLPGVAQTALPDSDPNTATSSLDQTSSIALPSSSDSPSSTPSPDTSPSSSSPHHDPNGDGSSSHHDDDHSSASKTGLAVGITVGLLLIIVLAALAWYFWRRRRRNRDSLAATLVASEGKSRSGSRNGSDNSSIGPASRIAFELASLKATLQDFWLAVVARIRPNHRERSTTRLDRNSISASGGLMAGQTRTTVQSGVAKVPMRARASTFARNLRKSLRRERTNTIESFNDVGLFPPLPSPQRSQSQPQRRPPSPISKNPFADPPPRSNSNSGRRRSSFSAVGPNPFTFHPTPPNANPFADPPTAPQQSRTRPPSISDPDFPLRNSNPAGPVAANKDPFADPLRPRNPDPFTDPLPPPLPTTAKHSLAARRSAGKAGWQPHHRKDSSDVIVLPGSSRSPSRETTGSELARWQRDREREQQEGQRGVVNGRDTMRSDPFDLGL